MLRSGESGWGMWEFLLLFWQPFQKDGMEKTVETTITRSGVRSLRPGAGRGGRARQVVWGAVLSDGGGRWREESELLSDRGGERSPRFPCFISFNPQNSPMGVDTSLIITL